ncbi:putative Protein FMP42 [Cardiosporidium cionae]|uniref:Uncharacterized protein n=1 Tax=Cardiosporidium cionae TaxID=476202 RepID=A0ABQ7JEM2_9APIC|nr:putative Protein FMP42 [Cardiosporidium cionae]|eukprot:KAF8822345.1 putative Protein FMP42 [Cardiosporidium cionae]
MDRNVEPTLPNTMKPSITKEVERNYKTHQEDEIPNTQLDLGEKFPVIKKEIQKIKTPCGIPRWLLLAIYSVIAVLTGAIYFGWQFLEKMFEDDGVYSWLCTANSGVLQNPASICIQQKQAIQFLYTIGVIFSNVGAFLSGFALDFFGPKIVGSFGVAMMFVGCALLAVSTQVFQLYVPAMILIGGMVEFESLALVSVCNLFPNHKATVIAVLMSCLDISWWVPTLMYTAINSFNISFSTVFWVYAIAITVPSFFILSFTLPSKQELCDAYENEALSLVAQDGAYLTWDLASVGSEAKESILLDSPLTRKVSLNEVQDNPIDNSIFSRRYSQEYFIYASPISRARSPSICATPHHIGASLRLLPSPNPIFLPSPLYTSVPITENTQLGNEANNLSENLLPDRVDDTLLVPIDSNLSFMRKIEQFFIMQKPLIAKFLSPSYFLIVTYFGWTSVRLIFFNIAVEDLLGTEFKMILGVVVPFTFLPVLVAGWLMDNIGLFRSILINNFLGSSLYIAAFFALNTEMVILKWITIIFFVLQNWNYTLLFASIVLVFGNKADFGVLVGTACLFSGVLAYLCNSLYSFALTGSNMSMVLVGMNIVNASFFLIQFLPCSAKAASKKCDDLL